MVRVRNADSEQLAGAGANVGCEASAVAARTAAIFRVATIWLRRNSRTFNYIFKAYSSDIPHDSRQCLCYHIKTVIA